MTTGRPVGAVLSNPGSDRVRAVRRLTGRSARLRERRFVAEGPQAVTEAVDATVAAVAAGGSPVVLELYATADAAARFPDVLEAASGYRGQRSRLYRKAKEQVTHSLVYSYRDRKARKSDFRKLWIQRINAASREQGLTYNRLIQGLKLAGVEVDRRVLADLAVHDAPAFAVLVQVAKDALPADVNAPSAAA